MKKTVSLVLVLVMMLSILAPTLANAEKTSKARAEELFNKAVVQFEPFNSLSVEEIKSFVTQDVFSTIIYNSLVTEIQKHEDLKEKLGDGTKLKAKIDEVMTDRNITILLTEVKAGKAVDSIAIIEEHMLSIEGLFGKEWQEIITEDIKNSAYNILDKLKKLFENSGSGNVTEIESGSGIVSESGSSKKVPDKEKPVIEKPVDNKFTDIANHWAKDEINAMALLGIVNGYPDGTFQPNGKVTRAEFSKMIVSALKLEIEVYYGGFSDVAVGQWHANFVATMVKNQLATGYPEGTFQPDGNITRNEMAMILAKILKLEVSAEEQEVLLSSFKDMKLIPNWAKAAVAEVVKAELMKGDAELNFNGENTATRAEAATVIYRLINIK